MLPHLIENLNSCLLGLNDLYTFNFEIEEQFEDIFMKDINDLAITLGSKEKLKNLTFKLRNYSFFNIIISSKMKSLNALSFDISNNAKIINLREFSKSIESMSLQSLTLNLSKNILENLKDL